MNKIDIIVKQKGKDHKFTIEELDSGKYYLISNDNTLTLDSITECVIEIVTDFL